MTFQSPSSHALTSSGVPTILQAADVVLAQVLVLRDAARQIYPLRPCFRVRDDLPAAGCRVDVSGFDPLVTGPAGVAGKAHPDRHSDTGAQRREQFQYRRRRGKISDFLDINAGILIDKSRFADIMVRTFNSQIGDPCFSQLYKFHRSFNYPFR